MMTLSEVRRRVRMPYVVSVSFYCGSATLAHFVDMAAAVEFARSVELARGESLEFRNDDRADGDGPMWDGEDVVTSYSDGLTEDEEEMLYEAGLR